MESKKINQSLEDGTLVRFCCNGIPEWEDTSDEWSCDNMVGVIQSLETYTHLGEKNYEYYNVSFFKGMTTLIGISGLHLTPLKTDVNYIYCAPLLIELQATLHGISSELGNDFHVKVENVIYGGRDWYKITAPDNASMEQIQILLKI